MINVELVEKYHQHIYDGRQFDNIYEIDYTSHDFIANGINRKDVNSKGSPNFWTYGRIEIRNCIFLDNVTNPTTIYTHWFSNTKTKDIFEIVSPFKGEVRSIKETKDGQLMLVTLDILKIGIDCIEHEGCQHREYGIIDRIAKEVSV